MLGYCLDEGLHLAIYNDTGKLYKVFYSYIDAMSYIVHINKLINI